MNINPERAKIRLSEIDRGIAEAELLHDAFREQADIHWSRREGLRREKLLVENALVEAGVFGYADLNPSGGAR